MVGGMPVAPTVIERKAAQVRLVLPLTRWKAAWAIRQPYRGGEGRLRLKRARNNEPLWPNTARIIGGRHKGRIGHYIASRSLQPGSSCA